MGWRPLIFGRQQNDVVGGKGLISFSTINFELVAMFICDGAARMLKYRDMVY
jgi:hypothetical protein